MLKKLHFFTYVAMMPMMASCAHYTYESTSPGKLVGQLEVVWVGEDNFVYWPYTKDPLRFELSPELAKKTGVDSITPGLMYTDGGSIPRPLRGLEGFSPWGYAPAYIFHDWLFASHHCLSHGDLSGLDPRDAMEFEKVKKFDFDSSVEVLAEVMKTLMDVNKTVKVNKPAFDAISFGVETPIARRIWDNSDPKSCNWVKEKHKNAIEKANAAIMSDNRPPNLWILKSTKSKAPAVTVFRYSFGR